MKGESKNGKRFGLQKKFNIKEWENCIDEIKDEEYFTPDLAFKKSKHILIVEQSSTNDRKVHIAELVRFLIFASENSGFTKFSFLLILTGKGESSPKVKEETSRLQFIYNSYPLSEEIKSKIQHIVIEEFDPKTYSFSEIESGNKLELEKS